MRASRTTPACCLLEPHARSRTAPACCCVVGALRIMHSPCLLMCCWSPARASRTVPACTCYCCRAQASMKSVDHIDLLKEQVKILSGEVALSRSILKRLSEEASHKTEKDRIEMEMRKIKEEINAKNQQISSLEKQISNSNLGTQSKIGNVDMSPSYAEIVEQLNEKTFELEVKTADNRVIQDQLQQKISECEILEETISSLKEQLAQALKPLDLRQSCPSEEKIPERDAETEFMLQEQVVEIEELR